MRRGRQVYAEFGIVCVLAGFTVGVVLMLGLGVMGCWVVE
jgi:hypothetical protein